MKNIFYDAKYKNYCYRKKIRKISINRKFKNKEEAIKFQEIIEDKITKNNEITKTEIDDILEKIFKRKSKKKINISYNAKYKNYYYRKKIGKLFIKKYFKSEEEAIKFWKIIDDKITKNNEITKAEIDDILEKVFKRKSKIDSKYSTKIHHYKNKKRWVIIYYMNEKQRMKFFDLEDEAIKFKKMLDKYDRCILTDDLVSQLYLKC